MDYMDICPQLVSLVSHTHIYKDHTYIIISFLIK